MRALVLAVLLAIPLGAAHAQDALTLELGGERYELALADVTSVSFGRNGSVWFDLDRRSGEWLAKTTARHIDKVMTISFDDVVLIRPRIRSAITAPFIQISAPIAVPFRERLLKLVADRLKEAD